MVVSLSRMVRRADVWGLALLPLLAVLLRLAYAATLPPRIVVTFEADPLTYDQIARNLLAGRGFSGASFYYPAGSDVPTAFWDALYPLFLAGIYAVAGHSVPLVRVAQAALGGVAVALTFWLGWRLAGRGVGLLAAAVSTAYPFFIYYSGQLLTETLFMVLILAVFAAGLMAEESGRAGWFLVLGLVIGLAALCRAEAYLFGLAYIAWAAWRTSPWPSAPGPGPLPLIPPGGHSPVSPIGEGHKDRDVRTKGPLRVRLWLAAVGLVGVAVVMAPWVARNQVTLGAPVLTTTKLGYNLYKYYHPTMTADQTVRTVPFPAFGDPDAGPVVTAPGDSAPGLSEPQREAVMRSQALEFMMADPGRTLWFMANKLVLLFKLTPSNDVNRQYALISLLSYGTLLPFMAAGLVLALRRGGRFLPLVGYVLFSVATKAAVFAGIRLRMQIEPFLIILAALAVVRVASSIAPRLAPSMAGRTASWAARAPVGALPHSRQAL